MRNEANTLKDHERKMLLNILINRRFTYPMRRLDTVRFGEYQGRGYLVPCKDGVAGPRAEPLPSASEAAGPAMGRYSGNPSGG